MKKNSQYVVSAVSHRSDGSMMNKHVLQEGNVQRFLDSHKIPFEATYYMKQVHGSDIAYVNGDTTQLIDSVDGLVTDKPNIFLGVVTADCVPVTLFDLKSGVIGVAHAGYKGLLAGVVQNLLKFARELGASNKTLTVSIGSCIGSCCYDIDEKRLIQFENKFSTEDIFRFHGDKIFLDLSTVAEYILVKDGVKKENIMKLGECTQCNIDSYFSYRGDSIETFGEFMTVIGMKK